MRNDQQSYEDNGSSASTDIELVPEVENPNDVNPGSSDASVNMYDFDSCFYGSSSDATSAVQNIEKQTSNKKICLEIIRQHGLRKVNWTNFVVFH